MTLFPATSDGVTTLTRFAALSEERLCGLHTSGGPHKSLHYILDAHNKMAILCTAMYMCISEWLSDDVIAQHTASGLFQTQ